MHMPPSGSKRNIQETLDYITYSSKMIERLLFWFHDGEEELYHYTVQFRPLAMLLNRLLNETYSGKKIKFLNLKFYTRKTYEIHKTQPNYTHNHGNTLFHNALFDRMKFESKSLPEQKQYLWDHSCEILKIASKDTKNDKLYSSIDLAYEKGIKMKLYEDFIMKTATFQINNKKIEANLWAEFSENAVHSKLKVKSEGKEILSQNIDGTRPDVSFFYEMYKKIILDNKNNIVIKGHYEVEYLPLKIPIIDKI